MRTSKGMAIQRIERDDDFWEENMKTRLSNFYDNCLLPEILDSRFLRNMPIRDPPYILQAKRKHEETASAKKNGPTKQNVEEIFSINEDIDKDDSDIKVVKNLKKSSKKQNLITKRRNLNKKRTKKSVAESNKIVFIPAFKEDELESNGNANVLLIPDMKTILKNRIESIVKNKSENVDFDNDDVIYDGSYIDPNAFDSKAVKNLTTYFETKGIVEDVNNYTAVILDVKLELPDDVMDIFLSIVKDQFDYEVQSILYQYFLCAVSPVKTFKSIAFLGGTSTKHWRLAYYDGALIHVYDTIPGYTGGKLVIHELNYVMNRYPNVQEKDIVFEKILTIQPDNKSCGIYAVSSPCHSSNTIRGSFECCFFHECTFDEKAFVTNIANKKII